MEIDKKGNKENSRPKQKVVTSFIKRTVPGLTAPLKSKNDQRDGALEKRAEPTKKTAVSKPAAEAKKAATLTQTFLSQQSSNYRKLLAQGPKPVVSAPPKCLPGTYKGKVIQSKVDCFRKPGDVATTTTEKRVFAKPAVPKTAGPAPATLSRVKSKSVTTLKTAPAVSQTQPRRPKSVTDVPLSRPANKTTRGQTQTVSTVWQFQATKRPAAATARAGPPPPRPVAGPKAPSSSVRPGPGAVKSGRSQVASKPPVATSQRPARKPVTSTLSYTRVGTETTEERRAKLAEWLAKKGKTLKRPPIHSTQPAQRSRPFTQPCAADPQPSRKEPASSRPAAREPGLVPEATAGPSLALEAEPLMDLHPAGEEEEEGPVTSSPATVMNTTLDMVDNCDLELPEVDMENVDMDNLVVNLCEALDAMETPSACESNEQRAAEEHLATEEGGVEMGEQVGEEEEIEEEQEAVEKEKEEIEEFADKTSSGMPTKEESSEDLGSEIEADSIEGSASDSNTQDDDDDDDDDEDDSDQAETAGFVKREVKVEQDDDDDEENNCGSTTPECNGASVVKYSVRTTPFLQSVKKRIDCGGESAVAAGPSSCGGSSRRRRQRQSGAIGDLKFLTPVRRSRRIERQSSRLPAALTERDPCVTSLAELARLEGSGSGVDNEANAYIYRRNPALLDELPGDLTRL